MGKRLYRIITVGHKVNCDMGIFLHYKYILK